MSGNWLSQAFYIWLAEHSELVPFFEIESFPANIAPEDKEAKLQEYRAIKERNVQEILDFSTEALVIAEPEISESSKPHYDSAKKAVYLFHLICFIRHEIYIEQLESFNASLARCSSIVSLLQSHDIPDSFNIKINYQNLYKFLLIESRHITCLRFKYQTIALEYEKNLSARAELSALISILHRTIDTCLSQMDRQSSYFYPNNADNRIQQILMCHSSPVCHEFEGIVATFQTKKRTDFITTVTDFFGRVSAVFDVKTQEECAVLIVLLVRVSFSLAYGKNPRFFYPVEEARHHLDPHVITCQDICAETNMLRGNEPSMPVVSVFGSNDFSSSVMYLSFAALHVNPIDALFEIHEAIGLAQRAVSIRLGFENSNILPFEQLFGPMIGVLLSSNFLSLGRFIIDFSPHFGLCPELEYTLATVQALMKYIESLESRIVAGEPL